MGKKTQDKMTIIKFLRGKNMTQAQIVRETKIPKSTVSRLIKKIENEDNANDKKKQIRTKLPEKYYKKIIAMATNKTTGEMSGGNISNIINEEFKKKNILNKKRKKILSISTSQVNRILKKNLIKRKVRKVFHLTEQNIFKSVFLLIILKLYIR